MHVKIDKIDTLNDLIDVRSTRELMAPIRKEFISCTDERCWYDDNPIDSSQISNKDMLHVLNLRVSFCKKWLGWTTFQCPFINLGIFHGLWRGSVIGVLVKGL